ncbi:MAG: Flp pilus assembly protein CpaB [Acidimicrobiia bacterium]
MGRRAVVLVIALLLAAAAAFAIFQYLNNIERGVLEGQERIPVYRALDFIQEGTEGSTILTAPGVLYKESFEQSEDLPADAIQTPEDLQAVLSGSVAVGPVSANGILTRSQWVAPNVSIRPLKESIAAGKQALTISPGDVQGINGFAQPGDLVNVMVTVDLEVGLTAASQAPSFGVPNQTGTDAEGNAESLSVVVPYTRFVLQNLKVLAVGQEIVPAETDATTVTAGAPAEGEATGTVQGDAAPVAVSTIYTLEVDPNQAERLVYAIQEGAIYMTLVPNDNQPVVTQGVTIERLFEGDLIDDIFD